VLGVIEFVNRKDILPLSDNDIDILTTVADYAAIALENARNYENVRRLTITDDITGLYNSRHLHSLLQFEIERARYEQKSYSIIFFDLDFFKQVNDTYGHLVGSRLLGEVGKLVAQNLKKKYSAARYGGDEFVIILPGATKKQAVSFCTKLKNQLNRKEFFANEGLNIRLTASFGIATYPDDADSKERLLNIADKRMYTVKDDRKNGIAST